MKLLANRNWPAQGTKIPRGRGYWIKTVEDAGSAYDITWRLYWNPPSGPAFQYALVHRVEKNGADQHWKRSRAARQLMICRRRFWDEIRAKALPETAGDSCQYCGAALKSELIPPTPVQTFARAWRLQHEKQCERRTPDQRMLWALDHLADESHIRIDWGHRGLKAHAASY